MTKLYFKICKSSDKIKKKYDDNKTKTVVSSANFFIYIAECFPYLSH